MIRINVQKDIEKFVTIYYVPSYLDVIFAVTMLVFEMCVNQIMFL